MSGVGAPSGTVTFLFTDVEGSTPLWDAFPDAMSAALARHDEIVRSAIEVHGGYVFSTHGDEFSAAFERAADAVRAALAAQRGLAGEDWGDGPALRVRMGLHTGEADERDGNFFGPAVNRAARIMGVANGGQVLVSELTSGVIGSSLGVELVDLGAVELKGVVEPVHLFGVAGQDHEWLDVPLLAGPMKRGNLPRLQTESVGDLADLRRRVAGLAQASVVTLTGSGGVGKTRAAVEIGWLLDDEFVDGVWLVELAPVTDPDLAATAIANSLGMRLQPGATVIDSIVAWFLGRRALVIFDNCEHLLDAVSGVVQAITASCPTVTIVATSREPLSVPGETVVRVPSLEARFATELFVLRARSADAGFERSGTDDEAISAICERLDGIPLAIELAAARVRSLTPAELLERLDDRFRLLRGGGRGGLERHQTLRAAVAWSYQLLTRDAQLLFDRLSVFAGSFDLAAAETICSGDGVEEFDVVDLLGELVDKSMVTVQRTDRGMRYRLLETLRQFGEERLDEDDQTAALRNEHLRYFNALGSQLGRKWSSPDQVEAGARFRMEWDNLGAAHAWAITSGDIDQAHQLVASASSFAAACYMLDHHEWCDRTLQLAEATGRPNPTTTAYAGMWAMNAGDHDRAIALGRLATELDPTGNDVRGRMTSILASMGTGKHAQAVEMAKDLRTILPAVNDPVARFMATMAIVNAFDLEHFADDAEAHTAAADAVGAPTMLAFALRVNAQLHRATHPDRAIAELQEAIRLQDSVGAHTMWELTILSALMFQSAHPETRATVHRTLRTADDQRLALAVEMMLELVPGLVATDQPHAAATIEGHIADTPSPAWPGWAETRAEAAELVDAIPDAARLRAHGAAMDRHQIVALALEALATPRSNNHSRPGDR